MFYIVYASVRQLKNPGCYNKEILLKYPCIIMASFWIIGLSIWLSIVFSYKTIEHNLSVKYDPIYIQTIINFFTWFSIDIAILIITIYLAYLVYKNRFENSQIINEIPYETGNVVIFKKRTFNLFSCYSNSYSLNSNQNQQKTPEFLLSFFIAVIQFL